MEIPTNTKTSEEMSNESEKGSETSPAVSRYGRTHKPKISNDFLPTDKKVGAILGMSPKSQTNLYFDAPRSSYASLEKTVKKGRLVSDLLGSDVRNTSKKRGRKPKAHLHNSVNESIEGNSPGLIVPSDNIIKSEVSTTDKVEDPSEIDVEFKEDIADNIKEENKNENEIMSPDVTSSVDDNSLSRSVWDQPTTSNVKDCGWTPGDLAWARVGGHPFWPCMVAVDPLTKVFTKIKRVGRGLLSVQRSLHVQFFGDNGRHSWVSTNCVIKFEGKDGLKDFANKVLTEIRKKDKKFSSAFVIRPSSKLQWDLAVREAEDALPRTNQERIQFFEELFPPEKYVNEVNSKKTEDSTKKSFRSLKRKRLESDKDEKPQKQVKVEPQENSLEVQEEKIINSSEEVPKKKRGKRKRIKKMLTDYRLFAEKYSKHASEIHPGITEDKLEKLMLRMWAAMDEQEKAMYSAEAGNCNVDQSSSDDEVDSNDNDNSSDSTRESSPLLSSQPLKKVNSLFRGTRQEKVCQICLKPGNTVKCKGSCLAVFHIDCIKNPLLKEEIIERDSKKKRGRLHKASKIDSELASNDISQDKTSQESLEDDSNGTTSNSETERDDLVSDQEESKQKKFYFEDNGEFRCKDCFENRIPCCFLCNKEKDPKTNSDVRIRCGNGHCGKYYHMECVMMWPQASCVDGPSKKQTLFSKSVSPTESSRNQVLTCPQHVCHTCASDDPRNATMRFNHERLVRCVLCPTAYHTGNYCIPAGSQILTGCQMICPRHYEPPGKGIHHVNAAWCFICAMVGGSLICCDLCPTSFHAECLRLAPPEGGYICEDCDTGRYPLYGEVVWVKLGAYRWWPAQILFPFEVPDNIENLPHKLGEFAVKFFGSHDHYWVNRGRVFLYQEGDTGHKSAKRTSVDGLFLKALDEAKEAHSKIKIERSQRELEARPGMKPPSYIRIKCNKPVGNVRVYEADPSSMTPCDCNPNSANPCGADSDCLNRILMVECTPGVCAAGDRCGNQCFLKREYPPLEPFKTESRGWGLRALRELKKGEFVIEYVGEMIDETEYRRRLEGKHKEKDENYYFLTIDNQRMLDAGPKGNVARFMNHSCLPNCETQKWTVNGDTRVGLFALKDIPAGQELTFNYNLECVGTDKKPCMCGAPNCSGFIGVKVTKPTEDDKKIRLNKQEQQKAFKRKKKRQSVKLAETNCFQCGDGGELLLCDNKTCPKGYHLSCTKRKTWPKGIWLCPWHFCDICKRRTSKRCGFCPRSFCIQHAEGNIRMNNTLGMVCFKHDEDTGKSTNAVNSILEDVEICLKGIVSKSEDAIAKDKSKPPYNSWLSSNDLETSKESGVNEFNISLESTNCVDSTQNSNAKNQRSVEVKVQNKSFLDKSSTTPKKRGRPRKDALPVLGCHGTPKFASPVKRECEENEIKTPEFRPNAENVSTLKKKRGRPRKCPSELSNENVSLEMSATETPLPNVNKVPTSAQMEGTESAFVLPTESATQLNCSLFDISCPPSTSKELKTPVKSVTKPAKGSQTKSVDRLSESQSLESTFQSSKLSSPSVVVKMEDEIKDCAKEIALIEGSPLVTPRTSSRKRHLSEKFTAFLSKSAKKHGLKSFVKIQDEGKGEDIAEVGSVLKENCILEGREGVSQKAVNIKGGKKILSKPKKLNVKSPTMKTIDSYMTKVNAPKDTHSGESSKNQTVANSVPSTSTANKPKSIISKTKLISNDSKHGKLKVTKITSPPSSKSRISKDKSDVSKSNVTKPISSVNESNKVDDSQKKEKPNYPVIFRSFQKKKTILQRVNHKPEIDLNKKLSYNSTTNNSLVNGNFELSLEERMAKHTASDTDHIDHSGSLYTKSRINGVDSNSLLESFDDTESNFLDENFTTIPIKCSEFEQVGDKFQTEIAPPQEIDSCQPLETEFSDLNSEENAQKLSEDGKYQILTNMRPESVEFDKQSSIILPVES